MDLIILSWNIGKNINKLEEFIGKEVNNHRPDILVIGLQETPVGPVKNGQVDRECDKGVGDDYEVVSFAYDTRSRFFGPKVENRTSLATCKGITSRQKGFSIYTRIYRLKATTTNNTVKIIHAKKICVRPGNALKQYPFFTKGYTACKLQINNNVIDIINTHLIFTNDAQEYNDFVNKMEAWLDENDFNSDNRILFGDINSRSLLTEECLRKDLDVCTRETPFNTKYCDLHYLLQ